MLCMFRDYRRAGNFRGRKFRVFTQNAIFAILFSRFHCDCPTVLCHLLSLSYGQCSLSYPTPGSSDTFYKEQVSHKLGPTIDTLFSMLMLSVCFLRTCFAPIDVHYVSSPCFSVHFGECAKLATRSLRCSFKETVGRMNSMSQDLCPSLRTRCLCSM